MKKQRDNMIYTGYFAKIKEYENLGLIPVAICGKSPDFYKGLEYKKFAPSWSIFSSWKNGWITNEEYTKRFKEEILDKLDKEIVKQDFEKLNKNVVLLCYEKSNDFCHRHIIRKWLNEELNIKCEELEV